MVARTRKKQEPVRIHLTKGSLSKYGYQDVVHTPAVTRRRYLARALKHEDALSVFRKLNALSVLNKNKYPATSCVFESDRNWVRDNYDI